MDYQRQYESVYGVEMWEHDFGGITLEEYVKNIIVSQLAAMKAVTLLAEEYEVTLTEAETDHVSRHLWKILPTSLPVPHKTGRTRPCRSPRNTPSPL